MGYFKQLEIERGKMIMGNAGIDYGMGKTNIDHETGIRYGVIVHHGVGQTWYESSEPYYAPFCPYCGNQVAEIYEEMVELPRCPKCNHEFDPDQSFNNFDPAGFTYNNDRYICNQEYDDPDIFVIKSPYFTYCKFCSPCAPGAGYLMDWFKVNGERITEKDLENIPAIFERYKQKAENAGYIRAYCFSHDFFPDNKAPYPVFSVETGELVTG